MEKILKFTEGGKEYQLEERYLGISPSSWAKGDSLWENSTNKAEAIKLIDAKNIDFAWIYALQQFDHWNVHSHSGTRKKLENGSSVNGPIRFVGVLSDLPEPDITRLWRAGIIYLAREIKGPNPLVALKRYRHLAHLLYSTGHIIGNRAAILMAEWEHNLLVQRRDIQWNLVDLNTLKVLKRVDWAWQRAGRPDPDRPRRRARGRLLPAERLVGA